MWILHLDLPNESKQLFLQRTKMIWTVLHRHQPLVDHFPSEYHHFFAWKPMVQWKGALHWGLCRLLVIGKPTSFKQDRNLSGSSYSISSASSIQPTKQVPSSLDQIGHRETQRTRRTRMQTPKCLHYSRSAAKLPDVKDRYDCPVFWLQINSNKSRWSWMNDFQTYKMSLPVDFLLSMLDPTHFPYRWDHSRRTCGTA